MEENLIGRIVNFIFEAGMLKKTPRTGYQFLGGYTESVADHSFRTAIIGFVLGSMDRNADRDRIVNLCLVHDLLEARTGDINYLNKKYVKASEEKALEDMASGLPFEEDLKALIMEFRNRSTLESKLANDADQLDLIIQIKERKDLGNPYADEWIQFAIKRLLTDTGCRLARKALETDSSSWWFSDKSDWWVNGEKTGKNEN